MFIAGLLLAVPSCFVEWKIVSAYPQLKAFFADHKIAALIFSTLLSFIIGWLFGATGLIVMMAAMVSTMMMNVVYGVAPIFHFVGSVKRLFVSVVTSPARVVKLVLRRRSVTTPNCCVIASA